MALLIQRLINDLMKLIISLISTEVGKSISADCFSDIKHRVV